MSENSEILSAASEKTNPFSSVPIEVTVSVGKARPLVKDLIMLGKNAVLPIDKRIDDAVDLYIGGRLIARGLLEEAEGNSDGQLVVRLTEVFGIEQSE